ncbi:prepilin peptidase [Vibrio breoganii]
MNSQIIFWSILFLISISDLKEHKIPNVLLVLLITYQTLNLVISDTSILNFVLGAICMFMASLGLFFVRAMSPGDVKLLGVIGYCVGLDNLLGSAIWITLSAGLVGSVFMIYNFSFLGISNPVTLFGEPKLFTRINHGGGETNPWRYGNKLTMPFAPSVTIGLALFYYFN